jgi:hypothetical protein
MTLAKITTNRTLQNSFSFLHSHCDFSQRKSFNSIEQLTKMENKNISALKGVSSKASNVLVDNTKGEKKNDEEIHIKGSESRSKHEAVPLKRYSSSRDLSKDVARILHEKTTKKLANASPINEETAKQRFKELMQTYMPLNIPAIQRNIVDHVEYTLARDRIQFDKSTAYQATAYSVRDRLIEHWNDTNL